MDLEVRSVTEKQLRAEIVNQAKSWVGRKEADGTHRVIIDVYNSICPLPRGYRMTYSDPWCAAFVSACAQVWGLTKIIFPECGCGPMIEAYRRAGRWMEDDAYVPQPGDVIFYDWQDTGAGDNTGTSDHVGIVAGVEGRRITIIEGNCADAVCYQYRNVDGKYIRGYGLPDYAAAASAINGHEEPEDEPPVPQEPESGPDTPATVTLPAPRRKTCEVTLPMLRSGDAGEDVRAMQSLLIARGYDCGPAGADGDFGPDTYGAVTRFQRERGLEVDGVVGPETWRKLICE